MTHWGRRCAVEFGPLVARLAEIAAVIGMVAFALGLVLGHGVVTFAALAASWLFFAGLSAGGVAVAAGIRIAQGQWARQALPTAEASVGFFNPALGMLMVLTLGAPLWMPSAAHARAVEWLPLAFRDLLSTAVLFWLGRRFVRADRVGDPRIRSAVAYALLYAVTLSLWAVDLVMSLHEWAPSTAIPAYYFTGAFVSGLAWITFVSCVKKSPGPDSDLRHNVGKLLFGFIAFLAYLLWSIFLATWYANLPDETGQLLARWQGAYRPLSLGVIIIALIFPFILLMTEEAKRHRGILALGAASVLLGLFVERFLLVMPSIDPAGGAVAVVLGLGTAAGVAGLFTLTFGAELASTG
jgi:Ni/Fe-hydrogenase subunit HybB-like protein